MMEGKSGPGSRPSLLFISINGRDPSHFLDIKLVLGGNISLLASRVAAFYLVLSLASLEEEEEGEAERRGSSCLY